jgi:hypothetical protein
VCSLVPPVTVISLKEQLGHGSMQVTIDTYGYLLPGGNRQAVDKLDGLEYAIIRNPSATTTINTVSAKRKTV